MERIHTIIELEKYTMCLFRLSTTQYWQYQGGQLAKRLPKTVLYKHNTNT